MRVVNSPGKPSYVIGLNWALLDPALKQSTHISKIVSTPEYAGVQHGVIVKTPGTSILGLPVSKKTEAGTVIRQKAPPAPSGAAWLALANQATQNQKAATPSHTSGFEIQQWVLVEPVGHDDFWLVCIQDGVPLPGTDVVADREEILELLSDILTHLPGVIVYTTDEDIQTQIPSSHVLQSIGFYDIVKTVSPKKARFVQVAGVPPAAIVIVLLFILGMAGAYGWHLHMEAQKKAAAAARAAKTAEEQRREQERTRTEYEQKVVDEAIKMVREGVKEVEMVLSTPQPPVSALIWQEMALNHPLNYASWNVANIVCEMETPVLPACIVTLSRGQWGLDHLLKERIPSITFKNDSAAFTLRAPEQGARLAAWKDLPAASTVATDLNKQIQLLELSGLSFDHTPPREITKTVRIPPPPQSITGRQRRNAAPTPPATIQLGVATGEVRVSGTDLRMVEGVAHIFNKSLFVLRDFGITVVNNNALGGWTMRFDYMVRTRPKPVIPPLTIPNREQPLLVTLPSDLDPTVDVDGKPVPVTEDFTPAPPQPKGRAARRR